MDLSLNPVGRRCLESFEQKVIPALEQGITFFEVDGSYMLITEEIPLPNFVRRVWTS